MTAHEEILSLLSGSPELHQYLLAHPEKLRTADYADIAAGAPIRLTEKLRLLLNLLLSRPKREEDSKLLKCYTACLNAAILAQGSRKLGIFSAELWRNGELIDGPYYAFSMKELQKGISDYRTEIDGDTNGLHWEIDRYCRAADSEDAGFVCPEYTYFAAWNGEIHYFLHNTGVKGSRSRIEDAFGAGSVHLNLPTPYHPGDILKIGGPPYASAPRYCMLTEVGDDCCGIQCLYPDKDGRIGRGALKHGHYFPEYTDEMQLLSPLYCAEVYTGVLPETCGFMRNPARGDCK